MRAPTKKTIPVAVPDCEVCGAVQTQLGAVLWGPPKRDGATWWSRKLHMCAKCYNAFLGCLREITKPAQPR